MSRDTSVRPSAGLTLLLLLFSSYTGAYSQEPDQTVKGELRSTAPTHFSDYFVEVVDRNHGSPSRRIEVRTDGTFEIRHLAPGEYQVSVTTLYGDIVVDNQPVTITPQARLELRLPERRQDQPVGRAVSARQLLHPPSRNAYRSFVQAQKFSASGDYAKATEALESAVRESPDYAEAHVNLGVQYIRSGRLPEAVTELKLALQVGGPEGIALCDLAWAQAKLGQRSEAIENARAGIRLRPELPAGHLILGALLAQDPASREEAIEHLKKAPEMKSARDLLAKLAAQ